MNVIENKALKLLDSEIADTQFLVDDYTNVINTVAAKKDAAGKPPTKKRMIDAE